MRKIVKISIILLVTGFVIFIIGFAIAGFKWRSLSPYEYETVIHNIEDDIDNINVDVSIAEVKILPSPDNELVVECYQSRVENFKVESSDKVLTITSSSKNIFRFFSIEDPEVTIYLPESEYNSALIKTATGATSLSSDLIFSSVNIESNTGAVVVESEVKESLQIDINTGAVKVNDVNIPEINICSDTGAVHLSSVNSNTLSIEGKTGAIKLENVISSEFIRIDNETGVIKFTDSDSPDIVATTATGSISGNLLTGKIFTARSSTGSVSVPDSQEGGGLCHLETSTGSITISIG